MLAAFELVLRQFYFVPWSIDPGFGIIVTPGNRVVYRREGSGTSRWTDHGVRRAAPVPASEHPVLVLGDSFTEAYMVDDDEVFTTIAEHQLAQDGLVVPVVNAGKAGLSPADYAGFAARNLEVFGPRWVTIQLRDDDLTVDAWMAEKTHFVRAASGALTASTAMPMPQWGAPRRVLWRLRQLSDVVNFTIIRTLEFYRGLGNEPPLFRAGQEPPPPPPPPPASYPIDDTIDAMVRAYDRRVTFLYFPTFDLPHPDQPTEVETIFDQHCRRDTLSCVNLRPEWGTFARTRTAPYGFSNTGFNVGHMNPAGHRVAGRLLAQELEALHDHGFF